MIDDRKFLKFRILFSFFSQIDGLFLAKYIVFKNKLFVCLFRLVLLNWKEQKLTVLFLGEFRIGIQQMN